MKSPGVALPLIATLALFAEAKPLHQPSITFNSFEELRPGSAQNIHVEYFGDVDGELTITYGSCDHTAPSIALAKQFVGVTHVGSHPLATRHESHEKRRPKRFVWLTPAEMSGGCLHAFLDGELIGRSEKLNVSKRLTRRHEKKSFVDVAGTDSLWFDGVAYLQQKQPDEAFVASAKSKSFGILGGGISGLMTSLLLDSVGIHNWKIIESSERVGGRIRTVYLNGTSPEEGQYHELGPMRYPYEITDSETNETFPFNDQRILFQLADVLNELNAGDEEHQVEFWDWIQSSPNTPVDTPFRRPDGTIPGKTEVAKDPAYYNPTVYSNETAAEEAIKALEDFKGLDAERIKLYATNIFKAYKQAKDDGMFDYSEVAYLRNVLKFDLNTTDEVTPSQNYWPMWEYETVYFLATKWKTIKGGLDRMPQAFKPLIGDRILYGAKVNGLEYNEENNTVSVTWKPTGAEPFNTPDSVETFDYVLNSVPLNLLKFWKLPKYSSLLKRAIGRTLYANAAKTAIQFKKRFWEHLERPILGGCTRLTNPQLGQVCYPGWHLNATGPGVMLASYLSDYEATVACAMPEAEHIAYIKRALIEMHGKEVIEENWTGNYARHCWEQDEHHAGAFTMQIFAQQDLYLPAFYQTEFNTVFIGEAATFTHTWMFSALESAIRGTVQLLLDMGLVDEAKQITNTWMARFISM
ncbi:L-amino-acid oxidase [Aaosphaeria arxii CBS 175.79]|uniref:L-amino-acid oxidase n=1 Tax=Aaosphaeria arxii CBS 175.79 TaxID=1450172 RepID=A0A6A5XMN3_9PLEO|nr:L-amino-acid oxidase [Aaosphaeria arxii CBS 175.79]KAF2014203.1 L-amino-acid oxidase [Aaosphaeria arxii CBS 175.79]